MGVPGFFLWLIKKYKKAGFVFQKEKLLKVPQEEQNIEILNDINDIDYFLIDTNCLIHPVCFKTQADNPDITDNEKLENKMINNVIDYLNKIIDYVNPKKGIYLAIDGVAPVAKIKQQRSRRFKSISDKILWDNIKKKHNKPLTSHWNNSAVTPGTVFMEKLHYKILEWAKNQTRPILYSSCLTPGEGEHKLLQFIRENQVNELNYSYVIYGLDADLIFLALSTNSDKIYLLREANEINSKESKDILNYVCIKTMRQSIVNTVYNYLVKKSEDTLIYGIHDLDEIKIVNDFIFMCYFLGNDFLPHIPSLDIHHNGIECLITNYIETMNEFILEKNKIEYLLNDIQSKKKNKVNIDFLLRFINKLSTQEETILRDSYAKGKKKMTCNGDNYEKEVFRIDNLLFKINDPIQLGSDNPEKWRQRYYKHYWEVSENELEEFSEKLVIHYLFGIKWVTLYYFDKCPSWEWYYPFDHPPFISDISKYLSKININKMRFEKGEPLKPFMQLLAVLPPQSHNLLPNSLSKLMINPKSSLAFMYPIEFEQDFINKRKYWMAIPKLPPLEIDLIKYYYNKYKDELKKEEKTRNEFKNLFEINI